ncbi:hypothetical protein [Haloterrigena salifodinae]|uniref:hypothetical protein n=1 Tax=Haloterrigena salifodinae TaxID=2675099 RepID=UPI000F873C57|nr:hypothetical protein [Haloterrigena salifodinae]
MPPLDSTLQSLVQSAYNRFLRPFLPKKLAVYNGVPIRAVKLLDQQVTFPDYEKPLIESVRCHANKGDTIVQIGGGRGPSTVAAVRAVEPSGHVIVYEGSPKYISKIKETLHLNNVSEFVDIQLKIVGEDRDVWGKTDNVEIIEPERIPNCDVLVLDCEGAEQVILPRFNCTPETLIVESHGQLGSPTEDVKQKVEERGYIIKDISPEVPEEDVYVITAKRKEVDNS